MDKELRDTLSPESFLKRTRPVVCIKAHETEDRAILEDILAGRKTRSELESSAREIAKRFGDSARPATIETAGSKGSLFALQEVNTGLPWGRIRLKFGEPQQIMHNLQHLLFLDNEGEGGWNAAFGYAPSSDAPLYISMVDGSSNCLSRLPTAEGRDIMHGLLLYLVQYGTHEGHFAKKPERVKNHLELVKIRITDTLSASQVLPAETKAYFATKAADGIKHLWDLIDSATEATWVLTDPLPENFTVLPAKPELLKGRSNPAIVAYDQGYSRNILDSWHRCLEREPKPTQDLEAFWGRIEYNLGQWLAALQMPENIAKETKDAAIDLVERLVDGTDTVRITAPFLGTEWKKPSLPKISPMLSRGLVSLGMAQFLISNLAYQGDNASVAAAATRLLDVLERDGKAYKIYPDLRGINGGSNVKTYTA